MPKKYVPKLVKPPQFDGDEWWYSVTGPYLPGRVLLRLALAANEQYVCTGLVVETEGRPLTTKLLRDIPLGTVISDVVGHAGGGSDLVWELMNEIDLEEHGGFAILDPIHKAAVKARGGKGPREETLKRFAQFYKAALNSAELRRKPVAAAADHFGIGIATAHKWIIKCREADPPLLDPKETS